MPAGKRKKEKKTEILLSTKRSGVAILTSQRIKKKKSPNNSKNVQNICLCRHVRPE